jgi:flagellar assembly protein FliH
MKWSDTIVFSPTLRDVGLLTQVPAQNWEVFLREREAAAYENGRSEGERNLAAQLEQQRQELATLQNGLLDSLKGTLPKMIQESESALIQLALESAQKIIAGMPVEATLVEAVVREALQQVEDTAGTVIQLHPEDLALLRKTDSPLLAGLPDTGAFRLTASSEVTRGGCIVQTRFGVVDARREIKVEQLRKALTE